jgi:ABC-type antimicrobial peptide transport system permease subunit
MFIWMITALLKTPARKILRDLYAYRGRTFLVITSVFIGVLSVVTFMTLGHILSHQLDQDIRANELAMLRVYLRTSNNDPINNDYYLAQLRDLPGITAIEGSANYQIQWRQSGESVLRNGEIYASTEPFRQIKIEPMRLIDGKYPAEGQKEIAIERRMADRYGLKVGDSLVLRTRQLIPRTQLYRFREETWHIVGVVFKPYLSLGSKNQNTSVFAHYSDAQYIAGFAGLTSIQARFENLNTARQESRAFRRYISNQTPYSIAFYLLDDPEENTFIVSVHRLSSILTAIAVLTMIVTSFLVTNVVSTSITEQRRQIGAMKAIGATRLDILRIYGGLSLVYGIFGTIPGITAGIPLGYQAAVTIAPLLNIYISKFYFPLIPTLFGGLLGLGIPLLASLIPLLNATRITILEAVTDLGIIAGFGKSKATQLARRLPLPIAARQALNNVIYRRSRLALSILAICLAVSTFMGTLAIFYSVATVIGDIRNRVAQDVLAQLGDVQNLDALQSLLYTEQEEAIRTVEPGVAVQVQDHDLVNEADEDAGEGAETFFVLAVDTETQLDYLVLEEGTGWTDDPTREGVVLTSELAENLEKAVGDMVTLATAVQSKEFEVIGIADFRLAIAFMEWHQLGAFIGLTLDAPIPNAYWKQVEVQPDEDDEAINSVYALGANEQLVNFLAPGRDQTDTNGVVLTSTLAERLNVATGQEITLKVDDNEQFYPILEVVTINPSQFNLFAQRVPEELRAQGSALEVVVLYWEELTALEKLDFQALSPATTYIDITNPDEDLDNSSLETTSAVPLYTNQIAFADRITSTISSVGLVFNFASLLLAAVGGIGLLTILSISVMERLREIGVLRSVGASTFAISSQFLLEGLLVGLIAWLGGVPLSYFLSNQLIQFIPFSDIIPFSYPLVVPIIGLISTIILTIIASLAPAIRASRKTVSEILRYQ